MDGSIRPIARGAAVREARAAGFDNISLDLMMWLPRAVVDATGCANVEALIEVAPDHASLYLLELYPNAPLKEEMARAGWSLAPDDDAAEMYSGAMERLEAAGYRQYEISNVARAGFESRAQPEILERRRVAGVRLRRPLHRGRRSAGRMSPPRKTTSSPVDADRRPLRNAASCRRETQLEEALFTGSAADRGIDIEPSGADTTSDVWERYAPALHRSSMPGWLCARVPSAAHAGRHADGQRSHGCVRVTGSEVVG